MKYKIGLLIVLFLVMTMITPSTAQAEINVLLDGKAVSFDVSPCIDKATQRTLVPFRQMFEALGAQVSYDAVTNSVTGKKEGLVITLPLNQNKAVVNGKEIPLDVAAKVVSGRTMVPLRFVSENMNCKVSVQSDPSGILTIYIGSLYSGTIKIGGKNSSLA